MGRGDGGGVREECWGHVSQVSKASEEGFRGQYKGGKWRESLLVSINMHPYSAL